MSKIISIHWFRQDLRTKDNPALVHAANQGIVIPVYILDDENSAEYKMGGASKWWLYYSLQSLNCTLENKLLIYKGNPETILPDIIKKYDVTGITWNRCYEPWRIKRDTKIKAMLTDSGITVNTFNGSLLWEPWEIIKSDNSPYRVFTPFYKNGCKKARAPRNPLKKPKAIHFYNSHTESDGLDNLDLLPKNQWYTKFTKHWKIGEDAALEQLNIFLREQISNYKEGRDFPSETSVSRLSPHLHFGELSPNQIWYEASKYGIYDDNIECFCRQLVWREFSYNLLFHNPNLPAQNLQSKFDTFPWNKDNKLLNLWQKGQTGIPIVDAGMRELWQTGYMHNRVRMIVGSFLVKNLLLDWRSAEQWFWDCLLDADLANNSTSWQWVAGCGADAAPYFRIFNPVTQGQKFDSKGIYTRQYVPELKLLPDKYLFNPWTAPDEVLKAAGVELGINYPQPIVELNFSRERALQAFKSLNKLSKL